MKEGTDRACDHCGKIQETKYFPYKTKNLCLICYEKIHSKTLHSYRDKINYKPQDRYQKPETTISQLTHNSSIEDNIINVIKKHGKLRAREILRFLSTDYGLSLDKKSVNQILYYQLKDKLQQDAEYQWYIKDDVGSEVVNEEGSQKIKETKFDLVKRATQNNFSLKMTYKGRRREVYPYKYNETYCVAYCTFRDEVRTFRIDRMYYVEVGSAFEFENERFDDALKKINNVKSENLWKK